MKHILAMPILCSKDNGPFNFIYKNKSLGLKSCNLRNMYRLKYCLQLSQKEWECLNQSSKGVFAKLQILYNNKGSSL